MKNPVGFANPGFNLGAVLKIIGDYGSKICELSVESYISLIRIINDYLDSVSVGGKCPGCRDV